MDDDALITAVEVLNQHRHYLGPRRPRTAADLFDDRWARAERDPAVDAEILEVVARALEAGVPPGPDYAAYAARRLREMTPRRRSKRGQPGSGLRDIAIVNAFAEVRRLHSGLTIEQTAEIVEEAFRLVINCIYGREQKLIDKPTVPTATTIADIWKGWPLKPKQGRN